MPIVFLIDDEERVRRALVRLIRSAGYDIAAFASPAEFKLNTREIADDACLILDVHLPGLNGIDFQRELQSRGSSLPVIFITGKGDIPTTVTAMKAGAVDFLPKPVKAEALFAAIEQALERSRRERAERTELEHARTCYESLTFREREVMALVVQGLKNQAIAERLGIVLTTIKVHRGRVMEKMEVKSVAELVRIAEKLGISGKEKP